MTRRSTLLALALGSLGAVAVAATAAAANRVKPAPEPVARRLQGIDRTEVAQAVVMHPFLGRFGGTMAVASMTSMESTREALLEQLRAVDRALLAGAQEAGLPEDTSLLAVLVSEKDQSLRVSTPDLLEADGVHPAGDGRSVSEVDALPGEPEVPAGGDAQPQDVSLPER